MTATAPANYLQPSKLVGGTRIHVGKTDYQVPVGSQIAHKTVAGHPVAVVRTPAGDVHQLHEKGELTLTKRQQALLHTKHFSKR
jgi:hypothetical protein